MIFCDFKLLTSDLRFWGWTLIDFSNWESPLIPFLRSLNLFATIFTTMWVYVVHFLFCYNVYLHFLKLNPPSGIFMLLVLFKQNQELTIYLKTSAVISFHLLVINIQVFGNQLYTCWRELSHFLNSITHPQFMVNLWSKRPPLAFPWPAESRPFPNEKKISKKLPKMVYVIPNFLRLTFLWKFRENLTKKRQSYRGFTFLCKFSGALWRAKQLLTSYGF